MVVICHDFFNFFSVIVLFFVEFLICALFGWGFLEWMVHVGAELTVGVLGVKYKSFFKVFFKVGKKLVEGSFEGLGFDDRVLKIVFVVVGAVLILVTFMLIVKVM